MNALHLANIKQSTEKLLLTTILVRAAVQKEVTTSKQDSCSSSSKPPAHVDIITTFNSLHDYFHAVRWPAGGLTCLTVSALTAVLRVT